MGLLLGFGTSEEEVVVGGSQVIYLRADLTESFSVFVVVLLTYAEVQKTVSRDYVPHYMYRTLE